MPDSAVKSVFTSKTMWFNAVALAVTFAAVLPPKAAAIVIPVGNIILRAITSQPVSLIAPTE